MRILIADDHPVVRQGLRQILTSDDDNQVVGEARNGDEALDLARSVDWDMAIFDFTMPGMSGLDLLAMVKREFPEKVEAAAPGHREIEDRHVPFELARELEGFVAVCRFADHGRRRVIGQHLLQAVAHDRVVIGYEDSHDMSCLSELDRNPNSQERKV